MSSPKPIHVPPGAGKSVNVIGNAITVKIYGRDTGGAFSVVESVDPPNGGPPPHIHHREDETFYVAEGEYEFMCDGKKFNVKKGATIFAPRGLSHTYKNTGKMPGRLFVTISPAGFEGFFDEVGAMSAAEQEIPKVVAIGQKYGLEFLPPA